MCKKTVLDSESGNDWSVGTFGSACGAQPGQRKALACDWDQLVASCVRVEFLWPSWNVGIQI